MNQTQATVEVWRYKDGTSQMEYYFEVEEVTAFDYSNDVLAVGEELHLEVVNPNGKYTPYLNTGDSVRVRLSNPAVNGGTPTTKHVGVVVGRKANGRRGTINVVSADLGWHLQNNAAPLWYNLRRARYIDLVDSLS